MYDHQALSRHRSQYPDTLCAVPSVDTLRSAVAVLVRYGRKTMDALTRSRYRKPPRAYTVICDFCDFSRTQQQQLWHALIRATWSKAIGWKQHLWLYENTELTSTETLLHTVCAPVYVVEVIEHLEREHLLPHIIAIGLEECVFNATDKNGRWCDHKSPKPLRR